MKQIKAFIKPHKADAVVEALKQHEGFTGASVSEVLGCGRGAAELVPHKKLEIGCLDKHVDEFVDTIQRTAHTGLRGDGKIYVGSLETAIRISTNARGDEAI